MSVTFVYFPKKYCEEIADLARKMKWSKDMVTVYKTRGAMKIVNKQTLKRAKIASTALHVISYLQSREIAAIEPVIEPIPIVHEQKQLEQTRRKPFNFRAKPSNEPYVFSNGYSR